MEYSMTRRIIRFFNVVMVAIVAGSIFGIWLGYSPKGLSAPTFIEQQQSAITHLNILIAHSWTGCHHIDPNFCYPA
jgi:hypothetical protein